MIRTLLILIITLIAVFFFLQGRLENKEQVLPVFLQQDTIARAHQTKINVKIHSLFIPDSVQVEALKKDYSNLWGHLNHLYTTNDVHAGKEYYTEGWFRQITRHYTGAKPQPIKRTDENHELHIKNWSSDGLVCSAIDSNVVFRYKFPDGTTQTSRANIAIVLLFQGDHWRIDALRVLNEAAVQ
jgi:hypothetical protein